MFITIETLKKIQFWGILKTNDVDCKGKNLQTPFFTVVETLLRFFIQSKYPRHKSFKFFMYS